METPESKTSYVTYYLFQLLLVYVVGNFSLHEPNVNQVTCPLELRFLLKKSNALRMDHLNSSWGDYTYPQVSQYSIEVIYFPHFLTITKTALIKGSIGAVIVSFL